MRVSGSGRARTLEVVSSVRGELEKSHAYAAQAEAHEECRRFLIEGKEQTSRPLRRRLRRRRPERRRRGRGRGPGERARRPHPRRHPRRRAGREGPRGRVHQGARRRGARAPGRPLRGRHRARRGRGRRLDRKAVEHAFAFACERHADQRRRSGEDFITHPVEVAKICAGLRLDTETLCAALLHDTVEDTSASLDEVRELFGDSIAGLVDGVTKLTGITFQSRDENQAENYRKMMVAMATDVRVILIKLADRLHNMRTISACRRKADREGARDARDLRAAGPPARDPRDQVGARGPRLPAAPPAQVRRDQEARLAAAQRAGALRLRRRRLPDARSSRRSGSRPRSRAAPSTSTRSTRR